jgi:iron complex outermembrane receptor protein
MSARFRRCFATFVLILSGTIAAPVAFAETTYSFNLPEQMLADSLRAIGQQTEMNILFEPDAVKNARSPALRGQYTVDEAIRIVLAGTKLEAQHTAASNIVVKSKAANGGTSRTSGDDATSNKDGKNSSSQDVRVAQVDQGATGPQEAVEGDQNSEKKKQEGLTEIVVTGTHIRGIDNKTSPVIVIDQAYIRQSGYSSTEDLFRSLPQNFSSGDAAQDGAYGGNSRANQNVDGSSGVNLRGLGVTSTLVLLNGHRLAPSAFGSFVDISLIPLSAIDRIEIMTEGSSAIYGSDAVGGVVNIILKKDYRGADTTVRYGATTQGGRDEKVVAQTLGEAWSSGNVVGTLQYERQNALPATDREFTSHLTSPNDLLPPASTYSMTLNAQQAVVEGLQVSGDLLASKRDFTRGFSYGRISTAPIYVSNVDGSTRSVNAALGVRYELDPRWFIELNGLYGQQKASYTGELAPTGSPVVNEYANNEFTAKSLDLLVNGKLGATAAGDVGMALGTSYRNEVLGTALVQNPGKTTPLDLQRHITAGYAEFYLPLVGKPNRITFVEALDLSAAVRIDKYSDFGSTTNPRVGLRWSPLSEVSLRASYGTSFRAPDAAEEYGESPASQYVLSTFLPRPNGPGTVPVLILGGSTHLTAERARTLNFGVEYKSTDLRGLDVVLNLYDIRYSDRIILPPVNANLLQQPQNYGGLISNIPNDAAAQSIVDNTVAQGGAFYDITGGVAGIRYLYDARQQNASVVRQSGVDFTPQFVKEFGAQSLTTRLNLSFIDKIDTELAQGTTYSNLVNTFGNPTRWRARLDMAWANKSWSVGAALNTVNSYINTAAVGTPPIASWTTVDFNARVNADAYFDSAWSRGLSLSLIVLNAFDRDPPYANDRVLLAPANYDPANANPLGRTIAVEIHKRWR